MGRHGNTAWTVFETERKLFSSPQEIKPVSRVVSFSSTPLSPLPATAETRTVHAEVQDLREINAGKSDLAVLLKDGEYAVRKIDGKWSISDYICRHPTKE
jgi:hypothetical protein